MDCSWSLVSGLQLGHNHRGSPNTVKTRVVKRTEKKYDIKASSKIAYWHLALEALLHLLKR